jgi:hypothetical protein
LALELPKRSPYLDTFNTGANEIGETMTTLITRLYASRQHAEEAAQALSANGFRGKHYDVIAARDGKKAAKTALSDVQADLAKAGVIPKSAATYAPLIVSGNALLAVRAPVGTAYMAKSILSPFESIDAGVRDEVHLPADVARPQRQHRASATSLLPRDAMILSGKKFLPALTSSSKTVSEMLGLPLLSGRKEPRSKLSSFSLSSMLGLPLLSNSET